MATTNSSFLTDKQIKSVADTAAASAYSDLSPVEGGTAKSLVTTGDKYNWNAKQNTLTFDTTPTENSTNPITSGGVYAAIGNISNILTTIISGSGVN